MIKRLVSLTVMMGLTMTPLTGCGGNQNQNRANNTNNTVVASANVSDGLDLSRLPALAKQARNADELERMVNDSGINNVDINRDGTIDYINVEEYRENGDHGFTLYTNEAGQEQELATISITQTDRNADMVVQGSPNYYGPNHYYHSSFPMGEILLAAWLFDLSRPRYYHPSYYRGHYPSYYRGSRIVPMANYKNRIKSYNSYKRATSIPQTRLNSMKSRSFGSRTSSQKSLSNVEGKSFSTTTQKRPGSSFNRTSTSSGFGASSTRMKQNDTSSTNRTFGGSSNRSRGDANSSRNSSFGGSSNRSDSGGSSRSRSFGGSSSRSRSSSGSSSSRRRR